MGGQMHEDSIPATVVDVVAQEKGVDPMDLPPLHGAIDPDALETVVSTGNSESTIFFVEFEFAERIVTIDGTEVSVRQRDS